MINAGKICRNIPVFLFISPNASSQPAVVTKKDIEMKKKRWIVYSIAQIAFIIAAVGVGQGHLGKQQKLMAFVGDERKLQVYIVGFSVHTIEFVLHQ